MRWRQILRSVVDWLPVAGASLAWCGECAGPEQAVHGLPVLRIYQADGAITGPSRGDTAGQIRRHL